MSRLFVQLIKRVTEKENVFTECLAASINEDPELARRFLVKLCGEQLDGLDTRGATINTSTQMSFPATTPLAAVCCVDMVLTLDGPRTIGVENKLFAEEGPDQLSNYLKLEQLTRVAYIRARAADVAQDVLVNPRYLKPTPRPHFQWSDFYLDVEACARRDASPFLTKALLELFLHFGFEPPKPEIGDLRDPDNAICEKNRQNFAKLWEGTYFELKKMGWKRITPGTIAELYLQDGPSARVKQVWLDPIWGRGLLRLRMTPYAGKQEEVAAALEAADLPHRDDVDLQLGKEPRRILDPEYVQMTISLRKLLGETTDTDTMKRSLAAFVGGVLRAAG